jgi:hypothetical protein
MKKKLFIGAICLICSISVFSQSKKTWEQTISLNSISAYQDFINKYPDGKYTNLAKFRLTLMVQEAERKKVEAQQEEKRKMLEAQKIAAAEAESSTDFPNSIIDKNIVSDVEMENIKKQLGSMSNPFTMQELYGISTTDFDAAYIKSGGKQTNKAIRKNLNSNLTTGIYATNGVKVDVISASSKATEEFISFGLGGGIDEFNDEFIKEYSIKRLFTLYKPISNETSGINFKKIIIWDTYPTPKNTYILKDGKWYNVK